MSNIHVTAKVNGDDVEFLCDPRETLLDVLRDRLNLTGTKEGCGTGDCGACTVTIEGRLVCSCLMLGVEASGKSHHISLVAKHLKKKKNKFYYDERTRW